jgi:hypothetical protein
MALSSAGVATLPVPEKPSSTTEIGAMPGDAIIPHTSAIARTTTAGKKKSLINCIVLSGGSEGQ